MARQVVCFGAAPRKPVLRLEDYPGEEAESYDPALVEERAIHLIDGFLVERLRQ